MLRLCCHKDDCSTCPVLLSSPCFCLLLSSGDCVESRTFLSRLLSLDSCIVTLSLLLLVLLLLPLLLLLLFLLLMLLLLLRVFHCGVVVVMRGHIDCFSCVVIVGVYVVVCCYCIVVVVVIVTGHSYDLVIVARVSTPFLKLGFAPVRCLRHTVPDLVVV